MPELIAITGPPGAGKSTVAAQVSSAFPLSALVVGDDVFEFLDRGYLEPWKPDAHAQNTVVVEAAAAAAGRFVAGGYTVVYDGVIGPWFVDGFLAATGLTRLHYAVLLPAEDVCVDRVLNRRGHDFADPDATRHMHSGFARAPIDPRHVIEDGSVEETAAAIVTRTAQGSLAYPDGPRPQ